MVSYRPHIGFFLLMSVYFLIRYLRAAFPELPDFVRFQVTDLLFVPVMCLFALLAVRYLKRDHQLVIPWYFVVIQTLAITWYFEWYLPRTFPLRYTGDVVDAVMYGFGALGFLAIQRRL